MTVLPYRGNPRPVSVPPDSAAEVVILPSVPQPMPPLFCKARNLVPYDRRDCRWPNCSCVASALK